MSGSLPSDPITLDSPYCSPPMATSSMDSTYSFFPSHPSLHTLSLPVPHVWPHLSFHLILYHHYPHPHQLSGPLICYYLHLNLSSWFQAKYGWATCMSKTWLKDFCIWMHWRRTTKATMRIVFVRSLNRTLQSEIHTMIKSVDGVLPQDPSLQLHLQSVHPRRGNGAVLQSSLLWKKVFDLFCLFFSFVMSLVLSLCRYCIPTQYVSLNIVFCNSSVCITTRYVSLYYLIVMVHCHISVIVQGLVNTRMMSFGLQMSDNFYVVKTDHLI